MPNKCKKIVAVHTDGSMAGCFDSLHLLTTKYNLTRHHIVNSCKTGKIYRGIRWMYEDEYHTLWLQGRTKELAYERPEWQKPLQRGDRVCKEPSIISLKTYVRTLTRLFGADITLRELATVIDTSYQHPEPTKIQEDLSSILNL